MSYLHIQNLYKDPRILMMRECFALEKVHGSSAHIKFEVINRFEEGGFERTEKVIKFFSGGCKHETFRALFPEDKWWIDYFTEHDFDDITIYGEAYGGKCQGMSKTHGDKLRFIAFEVKVGDYWLSVPNAWEVATKAGLEFVPFKKIRCTVKVLDRERDRDSVVAERRGYGKQKREGIVIRPLEELTFNNGARMIAKHKGEDFQERKTKQVVGGYNKLRVIMEANKIADEWVTKMRLNHVLDKLKYLGECDIGMEVIGVVIKAMIEDIKREAEGEIAENKKVWTAVGRNTARLFKRYLQEKI